MVYLEIPAAWPEKKKNGGSVRRCRVWVYESSYTYVLFLLPSKEDMRDFSRKYFLEKTVKSKVLFPFLYLINSYDVVSNL